MKGYYNRPAENEEAFTSDGWFRTGDIGHIDEDGFLAITDRKKELMKTSGGKYIAPQRVESLIKSSRFVSQVFVVGNARKFPSALIVPNMELLRILCWDERHRRTKTTASFLLILASLI